jgi:hypothetical protein
MLKLRLTQLARYRFKHTAAGCCQGTQKQTIDQTAGA